MQSRCSTYYKYVRKSEIMHLPAPSTVRAYTGKSTGEVGFTALVEQRLRMEASRLSPMEKKGSLQVDESTHKQKKKYVKNLGRYVGRVDMGGIPRSPYEKTRMSNKALAFVFSGLTTRYKICVAVFLVNKLTVDQQKDLTIHVIERLEALGFSVVRLVTVSAVRYMLELGFAFVLTRKFSSDDIETFFGSVRQMMGGNFQGDAYNFITAWERILRTGIAYNSISSNVILHRNAKRIRISS